ncbi:MAG: glycosyltransferase [Verrucomicrobia bacterium]|nr:glycosyltransferase [Verrucomicrobiota bacterium]MBS0646398.1 glycosyltransferase [Verrucomicrobiota bacterium]
MSTPLLSIVIPTYNYSQYLPTCLDSILTQDFTDFELILINDASTDSTASVLQDYAKHDSRIRVITHTVNQGIFASNNEGLTLARGAYLYFFSSDDWLLPGFLNDAISLLEAHPSIPFACCDLIYFEEESQNSIETPLLPHAVDPLCLSPKQVVQHIQNDRFWVPGLCCIMRRSAFQKYGMPDDNLQNISDWFFFHRIALAEGVGYLPRFGITMRKHHQTYTSAIKRNHKRQKAVYLALLRYLAQKENRKTLQLFSKTSLLYPMVKAHRFWALAKPCLWPLLANKPQKQLKS